MAKTFYFEKIKRKTRSVPLSIAAVDRIRREGKRRLRLSEPPQAVSFQRPVNSEKHKEARRAGTVGCPFWFVFVSVQ
jgi:hypothetical protein